MIFKKLFKRQENKVVNVPLKVVYYGPPGSGKTSNLLFLHEQITATEKDPELTRICSDDDPDEFITLFEAVPKKTSAKPGYQFSCGTYEANGAFSRAQIVNGVSGIIFVADSSPDAYDANIEALQELENNLSEYAWSLESVPWVIQYNKRDLPDAIEVSRLDSALNKWHVPGYEAVAEQGIGVLEPFDDLIARVTENFNYDAVWTPTSAT